MNGRHSLIDGYKSPRFASPEFIHLSKGLHGPSASASKALHCWFESVGHHITPSELIDLQHISSIADRINFGKVFPGRGI